MESGDQMVNKFKVLVVDDSVISHLVVGDILNNTEFDICSYAKTATIAVEEFKKCRPDIVTMDMNLPDSDGIECSRKILEIDPNVKIIMISAMKDNNLITKGTQVGVRAFLQKPLLKDELLYVLRRLTNFSGTNQKPIESEKKIRFLTDEEKQIHDSYITPFISSLQKNLFTLVGLRTEVEFLESDTQLVVNGIAVLISITGNSKGRFVLSVNFETAAKFTELLLGRTPEDEIAIESIEEFANIVAGRGVSMINDSLISNDLRISPPGTISGKEVNIINNNKLENFSVVAKTEIGDFNINIGFTGGE